MNIVDKATPGVEAYECTETKAAREKQILHKEVVTYSGFQGVIFP